MSTPDTAKAVSAASSCCCCCCCIVLHVGRLLAYVGQPAPSPAVSAALLGRSEKPTLGVVRGQQLVPLITADVTLPFGSVSCFAIQTRQSVAAAFGLLSRPATQRCLAVPGRPAGVFLHICRVRGCHAPSLTTPHCRTCPSSIEA